MMRTARARVDLNALRHNFNIVRQAVGTAQSMVVIKANGYGHGMLEMARALPMADGFAVACLQEALPLRQAGITQPILLLEGCFQADELQQVIQQQLAVVVHQPCQIEWLEALGRVSKPIEVWLKVDSGMHRLGFLPEQVGDVLARLKAIPAVQQPVTLMSHFANADDPAHPGNHDQLETFNHAVAGETCPASLANSAAILRLPPSHGDWVRPGVVLYGVSPFIDGVASNDGLKPVMTLSAALFAIRQLKQGDAVGYGGDWICPEDMSVGVISIGYGDGYPRHARPGTPVLVGGVEVPLVGRVSMDMITVDLRNYPAAQIGDEAVLWGEGLPIERVAASADTISYELLCGVTQRVSFEYLGGKGDGQGKNHLRL